MALINWKDFDEDFADAEDEIENLDGVDELYLESMERIGDYGDLLQMMSLPISDDIILQLYEELDEKSTQLKRWQAIETDKFLNPHPNWVARKAT